jgi:hypothetical protein
MFVTNTQTNGVTRRAALASAPRRGSGRADKSAIGNARSSQQNEKYQGAPDTLVALGLVARESRSARPFFCDQGKVAVRGCSEVGA